MGALRFTRYALSVSVVAVLLSACGGSSPLAPAPGAVNNAVAPLVKSRTFHFTGGEQTFRVPDGVTSISIVARGAQGGGELGARGGRVYAVIPVVSREMLHVIVGAQGTGEYGGMGGFNGGGYSGCGNRCFCSPSYCGSGGFGGGGASDIRIGGIGLSDRIVVAGGGGGEGGYFGPLASGAAGGKGGGSRGGTGQSACSYYSGCGGGGGGGSQLKGGAGGYGGQNSYRNGNAGEPGFFGAGGDGGNSGCHGSGYCFDAGADGGGGGGGYYGGGGGGGGAYPRAFGGGGGGGSSYIESKATKYQTWRGWKNAIGDGLVVISWK